MQIQVHTTAMCLLFLDGRQLAEVATYRTFPYVNLGILNRQVSTQTGHPH